MGLDANLYGKMPNGERVDLAYWRKHHPLHRYIVHQFADDNDKCQDIDIDVIGLHMIVELVSNGTITHPWLEDDEGYDDYTAKAMINAISRLNSGELESVFYAASW